MKIVNREYGSDFHYYDNTTLNELSFFDKSNYFFFFSGRVALYNLLAFGIRVYQWKKVGFPSYYCHEVVDFCRQLPIEIIYYEYDPISEQLPINWEDELQHVFINVDFFGVKKIDTAFLSKSVIVDDVTHNLLSVEKSTADYCFGSLRKQLPVGVGGFCFAKSGDFSTTISENSFANRLAMQKLSAMYLKSAYLNNLFNDKDVFRALYTKAEEEFESLETNAKLPRLIQTQLFSLPIRTLIEQTHKNINYAKNKLKLIPGITLLASSSNAAMGILLFCESEQLRDNFISYLINSNIFPAILWPGQFTEVAILVQNRILFIHADFRYDKEDVNAIIYIINNYNRNVSL